MCMFCAAIPVAATTGVTLNSNQLKAKRQAESAGVLVLLFICSATYHTLTSLPY